MLDLVDIEGTHTVVPFYYNHANLSGYGGLDFRIINGERAFTQQINNVNGVLMYSSASYSRYGPPKGTDAMAWRLYPFTISNINTSTLMIYLGLADSGWSLINRRPNNTIGSRIFFDTLMLERFSVNSDSISFELYRMHKDTVNFIRKEYIGKYIIGRESPLTIVAYANHYIEDVRNNLGTLYVGPVKYTFTVEIKEIDFKHTIISRFVDTLLLNSNYYNILYFYDVSLFGGCYNNLVYTPQILPYTTYYAIAKSSSQKYYTHPSLIAHSLVENANILLNRSNA